MVKEKQKIIRKEGLPVSIISLDGTVTEVTALIGRASKQFNSTLSLEHYRRGYFLPSAPVACGHLCYVAVTNETCLMAAVYPEIIRSTVASIASHMMVCNTVLTISREEETADARGNITTEDTEVYEGLMVYIEEVKSGLKQYEIGLHPDTEYLIYATGYDIQLLDKAVVTSMGRVTPLKVISTDYSSYPGMVVIQAKSETRVISNA